MNRPPLAFTRQDMTDAFVSWGCNCGPTALAASLALTLDAVRDLFREFAGKGYVSPSDMEAAINLATFRIAKRWPGGIEGGNSYPLHGVALIQFDGPWRYGDTKNAKWAMCHTHWIATKCVDRHWFVFDCNQFGWLPMAEWERQTLPRLLVHDRARNGDWWLLHSWEIRK